MQAQSMELAWIVVNDLKQAVKFYTEIVGLELMEFNEQYGWAELQGKQGGAKLGIAQASEEIKAGQNAHVTFTVANIAQATENAVKKGAKPVGPMQEVPGHVKLQTFVDQDGNHLQLVEKLSGHCCC
jgi:predicted enzyme related to lactoylglutathione lyase